MEKNANTKITDTVLKVLGGIPETSKGWKFYNKYTAPEDLFTLDGRYEFIRHTQNFDLTFKITDVLGIGYFLEVAKNFDWWYRRIGGNE